MTASLKAAQVSSELELLESTCGTIVTRILIQTALQRFYQNNDTQRNWERATADIQSALASGGYSQLLQVRIYSRNGSGDPHGLLNVTYAGAESLELPMQYPNGTVRITDLPQNVSNMDYSTSNLAKPRPGDSHPRYIQISRIQP